MDVQAPREPESADDARWKRDITRAIQDLIKNDTDKQSAIDALNGRVN